MTELLQRISTQCIGHRARIAARKLTRHYNAYFRPLNLTAGQFGALVALAATDVLIQSELAERLGVDSTTLIRSLRQLHKRGLIATDGGRGRQGRRAVLTSAGRALLRKAIPRWEAAYASLVKVLGGEAAASEMVSALTLLEKAGQIGNDGSNLNARPCNERREG